MRGFCQYSIYIYISEDLQTLELKSNQDDDDDDDSSNSKLLTESSICHHHGQSHKKQGQKATWIFNDRSKCVTAGTLFNSMNERRI